MPDYGKMAWLRTEELLARVEALENRKGMALGLTLNEEVLRSVTEHNLITLPVQGEAGGSVEFRAALTVLGGEAGAGKTAALRLAWDGTEIARFERTLAEGGEVWAVSAAFGALSGRHTLTADLLAEAGSCYLERAELTLTGTGVREEKTEAHYAAFGSRYGEIFLLERKGGLDLVNQSESGQTITTPARTLPRPDDFAACEIFSGQTSHTLFLRLTGRELYGGLLNLLTGVETLQKVAGGVTSVSCVTTDSGALAAAVVNGGVFVFPVTMTGETLSFGNFSEVRLSGMAEKVCLVPGGPHLLIRTGGVFYLRTGSASGFSPALRVGKGETCNGWTDEDGLHLELGGEGCVTALDLTGGALTQPAFVRLADEVKRHGNYILSRTSDRYMMERLET